MHTDRKRILIVDDHPVFRKGLESIIANQKDLEVCGEAGSSQEAITAVRALKPEVVLLDISLPGTNGIELTKTFLAEFPKLIILVLSMHDELVFAVRALRAGAKGYVMKAEALANLMTALEKVLQGGIYVSPRLSDNLIHMVLRDDTEKSHSPLDSLSDREMEVFNLIGKGMSTKEMAGELGLSVKTIETHRVHVKDKLGLQDARQLSRFAIDWRTQEAIT